MYRVELTPRATRELDGVPAATFARIDPVIAALAQDPRPRGVKKLRGPIHRLRVGQWRLVYAIFDRDQLVVIGKVARRGEDTYDDLAELF